MFPYPVTVTLVQFAVGSILVILMWSSNLYKRPKISGAQVNATIGMSEYFYPHSVDAQCGF